MEQFDSLPLDSVEKDKIETYLLETQRAWEILKIGDIHPVKLYFPHSKMQRCPFCRKQLEGQEFMSVIVRYKAGTCMTTEHAIYSCRDLDACRFRRSVEDP